MYVLVIAMSLTAMVLIVAITSKNDDNKQQNKENPKKK